MKGATPAKDPPMKEEGNDTLSLWATSALNTFGDGLAFVNNKFKEGQENAVQYSGGVQPSGKARIPKAASNRKPRKAVQQKDDTEILQQFRAYRALVREGRQTMKDTQGEPRKHRPERESARETRQEEDTIRDTAVGSIDSSALKQESYVESKSFVVDPLEAMESRVEATMVSLQTPNNCNVTVPNDSDVNHPALDTSTIEIRCDESAYNNISQTATATTTEESSKEPLTQLSSDTTDNQLEQYLDSPQAQVHQNVWPSKFDNLGDFSKSPLMREIESLPSFHTMTGIATLNSPLPTSSVESKEKDTPIVVVRDVVNESDIISILEEPHGFNMFNFSNAFAAQQLKSSEENQNREEQKAFSIWKEFLQASDAMKQCGVQIKVPRNATCFRHVCDDNSSLESDEAGEIGKTELFGDIAQFWTGLVETEQKESFLERAKEAWDREFAEDTKELPNSPKPDVGEKFLLHLFGLDDEKTVVSDSCDSPPNRQTKGRTRHRSRSREGRSQMRTAVLGSRGRSTSRGSIRSSSSHSRASSLGRPRRGLSSHRYTGRDESGRREAPDFIDVTLGRDPDWTVSKKSTKSKHKHMTRRESHKQERRRKGVERNVSADNESASTHGHLREVSNIGQDVFSMAERTLDKKSSRQSRSRSQSRRLASSARERARSSSNRPSHRRPTSRPRAWAE